MLKQRQPYKKHFKRDKSVNIRLTKRDLQIIKSVYQHRFLSSEQVLALLDGSNRGLLKRLQLLFHSGYLDRLKQQAITFSNQPLIYALGNRGAELLAQELDMPLPMVDWTSKNREVKGVFVDHSLMVANFLIIMKLACQKQGQLEFIEPDEIIDKRPIEASLRDKPLSWKVEALTERRAKISFSIVPDSACGLWIVPQSGKQGSTYFFIEADRSTMPIKRSNMFRSSFYKKMIGYWSSWKQGLFARNFGFKNPRLLTITLSKERIKSMIKANQELDPRGKGLRMFLFASEKTFNLSQPEKVFDKIWVNGRGETVSIID